MAPRGSQAGEADKGFAVVAEEVRSLASRSAEAARETTVLLGETVGSIDEGTRAAQETSESMLAVVTHADEMSGLIDSIAENTSRQAEGAAEIAYGIEQISSVVDSNADNAQRSAAASEELSGQAEMLKNLVATFKIKGRGKPAVVCPLMLFSTSTPKPRAEGSNPSAPATPKDLSEFPMGLLFYKNRDSSCFYR